MQIKKMRNACCVTFMKPSIGVKARTGISDRPVRCFASSIQLNVSRNASHSGLER